MSLLTGFRMVQMGRRALNPPGDAKQDLWIIQQIAQRMGVALGLTNLYLKRLGRNLTTFGPMLTGAAVASYLNRRATLSLGEKVRKDLGGRKQLTP